MMLSAATSTISVRIRNITFFSTSSAEKKVALRSCQEVSSTWRLAARSIGRRMASTMSALLR